MNGPDGAPAVYTHGHHESVLRAHRWRTAANSAGYLLGDLRPGMAVLDVGCGPGTVTADLADLVAPGRVTAVDTSTGVLAEAGRAAARGGHPDVTFAAADAGRLCFPDGSFDLVHAHQVLQHLADPVGALREMCRVCRPGGVVAARDADYAGFTWYPPVRGLDEWQSVYRRTARRNGAEPDAGRRLLSWARAAGFAEVRAGASVWCFAGAEDRAWWSGSWAERTTRSAFARQAVRYGLASQSDLERMAEAWHAWGAHPDGWMIVPHGEIRCRGARRERRPVNRSDQGG